MKHPARILAQYGGAVILFLSGFTGDKDLLMFIRYLATAAAVTLIYFAVRHGRSQWGVTLACVALGVFILVVSPWSPSGFWPTSNYYAGPHIGKTVLALSCVPFALFSFFVGRKGSPALDCATFEK